MRFGTAKIIRYLESREAEGKEFPRLFKFYRELLQLQLDIENQITPPAGLSPAGGSPAPDFAAGRPLIQLTGLALDEALLRKALRCAVAVFSRYPDLFGTIPDLESNLTPETVRDWLEKGCLPTPPPAGARPELLNAILQAVARPFVLGCASSLEGQAEYSAWRRGYCPVCGAAPDFAYLDTKDGSRWLVCSLCDTEWLFQRLQCPYCGTQDQNALSYLTDDGGLYRLYLCDNCKGYIKAIDLRQAKGEVMMPLERLNTLDLDSQAQAQGYHSWTTSPSQR